MTRELIGVGGFSGSPVYFSHKRSERSHAGESRLSKSGEIGKLTLR